MKQTNKGKMKKIQPLKLERFGCPLCLSYSLGKKCSNKNCLSNKITVLPGNELDGIMESVQKKNELKKKGLL